MAEPHRVLVVDDEALVRAAYRSFFATQRELVVCGEAGDGAAGVEAYASLRPDLVLMDLQMPVLPGVEATRQICTRWPGACVVVMTTFDSGEHVVAALRAGASGYLLKHVGGPGLLAGVRQALAGDMPLSGAVRRELVASVVQDRTPPAAEPGPDLTDRERELLGWLAQGLGNVEIGSRMHVSEGAVKQYLQSIGRKLGVRARTGILVRSIQLGLVDPRALPPVRG